MKVFLLFMVASASVCLAQTDEVNDPDHPYFHYGYAQQNGGEFAGVYLDPDQREMPEVFDGTDDPCEETVKAGPLTSQEFMRIFPDAGSGILFLRNGQFGQIQ